MQLNKLKRVLKLYKTEQSNCMLHSYILLDFTNIVYYFWTYFEWIDIFEVLQNKISRFLYYTSAPFPK